MDFDDAKENIQPLASGRNASILQASISHTHEELLEQRREFEREIHTYDGDDPLEPYYNYISWIEQSFPSGGKESGLMEVLRKCLRRFESEERYYQDRRMIKIIIKLLDSHKDSSECYQQLYNAGIGTMVADFYIAWAYCYDSIGQMRKADEIFRRGIACRAEPLAELKEAHQHFGYAVAQRMLYKDDHDTLQDTNRQIEERRSALSSLRGYRNRNCKGQIGSIRTGIAIKSLKPGTVGDDSNRSSSCSSNARIPVLTDENVNPCAESTTIAGDLDEQQPKDMPSSIVVRSIVDKARHQENERDPGPWNKVNDESNKKKLIRQKKIVHQLGFNIHEDEDGSENESVKERENCIEHEQIFLSEEEQKYNKPFIYPPNFVSKNSTQPEWILPITTECQADANTLPCYNKCMIYPRPNREFQPEELQAYLYFKRRGMKNVFTQRYNSVWGNDITVPLRLYPNFVRASQKQSLDELDKFFVPPTSEGSGVVFIVPLKKLYNIEEQEEFQNEELMAYQLMSTKNKTVIELEDMDETMCANSNNEQVQRRKSFFPTRRSLAIRSVIAAKLHNETYEGSLQSSIHLGTNKTNNLHEIPEEKTYAGSKEETKSQCGKDFAAAAVGNVDRMVEREGTNTVSASYRDQTSVRFEDDKTETVTKMVVPYYFQDDRTGTIPKLHDSFYPVNSLPTNAQQTSKSEIIENLDHYKGELSLKNQKELPSSTPNSDDFHFKTPALPMKSFKHSPEVQTVQTVLSKLPFEIYVEENNAKPEKPIYEADETFSTQVFNDFIKSKPASTPKMAQKMMKRVSEISDEMTSSARIETVPENTMTTTTTRSTSVNVADVADVADAAVSSPVNMPTNSFSLLVRKQLSTILETSEHGTHSTGTSSKSTNGSQESEFADAAVNGGQHQNIERTNTEIAVKASNFQEMFDCATEKLRDTSLNTENEGIFMVPNQKQTPFAIYVDDTETLPQLTKAQCGEDLVAAAAAAVGNFDRMVEREDTNTGGACYRDQISVRFQDDKTETVTKMVVPYYFQDDRTGTIPKLHNSIYPINSLPTTAQPTPKSVMTSTSSTVQSCFKDFENDEDDDCFEYFRKSPPKAKKIGKFNFYEPAAVPVKVANIKQTPLSSVKCTEKEKSAIDLLNYFENIDAMEKSPNHAQNLVANSTGYTNSNMKNVEKNIGNSFFPELSLIAEPISKTSENPSNENSKGNKKSQNETSPKARENISFSLAEFTSIGESQPVTKNSTKPFKQTDLSGFSLIVKETQETYAEATQKSHYREKNEAAQKSMPKIILESSFLPNISSIEKSPGALENTNSSSKRSPKLQQQQQQQHNRMSHIPKPVSMKKSFNDDSKNKENLTNSKTFFTMSKEDSFIPETQERSSKNIEANQKSQRTFLQVDGVCNRSSNASKEYSNSKALHEQGAVKAMPQKPLEASFFEMNAETEMFSTGISMIKNSTMRNSQGQGPPSLMVTTHPEPDCLNQTNDQPHKSHCPDDDMSIYFKHSPRTPILQIHDKSWSSESEDAEQDSFESGHLHHEVDLNETTQRIENICKDENVNPFNTDLLNAQLDKIDFVHSLYSLENMNLVARVPRLKVNFIFSVANVDLKVTKLIAEGAYGTVYRGVDTKTGKQYAFKQERPPNYWELYICLEVRKRLVNEELLSAYMHIDYALIGNNASIFLSSLSTYGSIINVCNKIKKHTLKNVDEYVVMHLTCELLEIIDHLHATSIIHADIKADNFLLMKKLDYNSRQPSLQLIDFGVSIDMKLFKPNQTFTFVHNDIAFKCVEMRENRPWTYQLDLYGLAGVIHVMLFGKYMDIERRPSYLWMPKTHMPRYINKKLWESIFGALLNVRDCKSMPNLQQLRSMIKEEIAAKEGCVVSKIAEFNKALDC